MSAPLVVVGDVLLDRDLHGVVRRVTPDAPAPVLEDVSELARPGGAGLAAVMAADAGHEVVLVTALSNGPVGERLRSLLENRVEVLALRDASPTREKIRLRAGGTSLVRVDRGGPPAVTDEAPRGLAAVLRRAGAVLVSDYAGGVPGAEAVRRELAALSGRGRRTPLVWDPHPRGAHPVRRVTLATPNQAEAAHFAGDVAPGEHGLAQLTARAEALAARWSATGVAVTMGSRGALLSYGTGAPLVAPAPSVEPVDSCGAGDMFAVTATAALAAGGGLSDALTAAVSAAADWVAGVRVAEPASTPAPTDASNPASGRLDDVLRRVRATGGTVVATGGCFDLLHAGHVSTLRAARSLGDCLVVLLNSDASVRRLKGASRPLVSQEDRARVLEALECVDAVVVFDDDTPEAALARLRPDVWAKGGDYADHALPEAALMRQWGGQTVVLPYLDGRSTTGLVRAARAARASEQ